MEPSVFKHNADTWRALVYEQLPEYLHRFQPGPELAVKWYNLLGGRPLPGQPLTRSNQGFMAGYQQLAAWFEGVVSWLSEFTSAEMRVSGRLSFNERLTDTVVAVLFSLRDDLGDDEWSVLAVVADLNAYLDEFLTPERIAEKEAENPLLDGESEILMDFIAPRRLGSARAALDDAPEV